MGRSPSFIGYPPLNSHVHVDFSAYGFDAGKALSCLWDEKEEAPLRALSECLPAQRALCAERVSRSGGAAGIFLQAIGFARNGTGRQNQSLCASCLLAAMTRRCTAYAGNLPIHSFRPYPVRAKTSLVFSAKPSLIRSGQAWKPSVPWACFADMPNFSSFPFTTPNMI